MPADVDTFDMLNPGVLLALPRERLEAELGRVTVMLERVAQYHGAVLQALAQAEP